MSTVYWHTRHRTVELRGSERAWLGRIAEGPADVAWGLNAISGDDERAMQILAMVPEHAQSHLRPLLIAAKQAEADIRIFHTFGTHGESPDYSAAHQLVSALATALHVENLPLDVAGHRLYTKDVGLNTALVAGSDVVRLAAKIDMMCEVHCWIEESHQEWTASIIEEGLRTGIYRQGLWYEGETRAKRKWMSQGWEEVLDLLRSPDTGPVVMSYSVERGFPTPEIAQWDIPRDSAWRPDWAETGDGAHEWNALTEHRQDEYYQEYVDGKFYQLALDEQWDLAFTALRKSRPWAQLSPEKLAGETFGPAVSIYDLFAPDREARVVLAFQQEKDKVVRTQEQLNSAVTPSE